ncbi:DUF3857 domain-containing protein [Chitinophaga sp.]|uniref:DUF3857 domain-containing protein n=1 Tax=Chitinophaga sp. TaxID=1869181 RepID=UPI0031D52B0B
MQNGSEINVEYSPEYEKLQFHQIQIRRNGQVINQLNLSKIKALQLEQDLSMFIYSGRYNAWYSMEDVRKGDQIEYAYSIIGENPVFDNKYSNSFYFTSYDPVANFYKALIVPSSRQLQFRYYSNAPRPAEKIIDGMHFYEWDLGAKVHIMKPKDHMPAWYVDYPYLEVSEFENWAAVAKWAAAVNNIPLNGREVAEKSSQLKAKAGTDTARYIEEAIRFVQEDIRYMGIEIGEYSHRPNSPEKVCKQRFGDCKDKSLLLVALLRAGGVGADMAYVNTAFNKHVAGRLPSPDRFNHAIVKARFNDQNYWIDATASYQRGRLANRYNAPFGMALLVTDTTTNLSNIPLQNTGRVKVTEEFVIHSVSNDSALLTVTSEYTGMQADYFRSQLANSSLSEMENSYKDFYVKKYGDVETRGALVINDIKELNKIITEELYTIRQPWTIDSSRDMMQSFHTPAHIIADKITFVDKSQVTPVALEYPQHVEHIINIELPEQWQVEPAVLDLNRADYRLIAKKHAFMKTVRLEYMYETKSDHIAAQSLNQYRLDLVELDKVAGIKLTWKPGINGVTAKQGRTGVNWFMVCLAIVSAATFGWLCAWYNKRSLPVQDSMQEPWRIDSWLLLLAFGIILSPVRMLFIICQSEIFQNNIWLNLATIFPSGNIAAIRLFWVIEIIVNVFLLVAICFAGILFFRRRDIFPRVFVFLLLFNVIGNFADFLLMDVLTGSRNLQDNAGKLVPSLLNAAIWIPVMRISHRVKHTFVVPYNES